GFPEFTSMNDVIVIADGEITARFQQNFLNDQRFHVTGLYSQLHRCSGDRTGCLSCQHGTGLQPCGSISQPGLREILLSRQEAVNILWNKALKGDLKGTVSPGNPSAGKII